MILIFAGAGASKATNPDNYPDTIDFYKKLPDEIKNNPLFIAIRNYLTSVSNEEEDNLDIEKFLWLLEELKHDSSIFGQEQNILSKFMMDQQIQTSMGVNIHIPNTKNLSLEISRRAEILQNDINRCVFNFYVKLPSGKELDSCWIPFLNLMIEQKQWIELFTTNYDQVIESALTRIKQLNKSAPEIKEGRTLGIRTQLDTDLWDNLVFPYKNDSGGIFTKLHGSIDWIKSGDMMIYVGNPTYSGENSNHMLLYPGYKPQLGKQLGSPFALFYNHLKDALNHADTLIFIGYSFRDEDINEIIRSHMRSGASLILINKTKLENLEKIFPNRRAFVQFTNGFNNATVDQLALFLKNNKSLLSDTNSRNIRRVAR